MTLHPDVAVLATVFDQGLTDAEAALVGRGARTVSQVWATRAIELMGPRLLPPVEHEEIAYRLAVRDRSMLGDQWITWAMHYDEASALAAARKWPANRDGVPCRPERKVTRRHGEWLVAGPWEPIEREGATA